MDKKEYTTIKIFLMGLVSAILIFISGYYLGSTINNSKNLDNKAIPGQTISKEQHFKLLEKRVQNLMLCVEGAREDLMNNEISWAEHTSRLDECRMNAIAE